MSAFAAIVSVGLGVYIGYGAAQHWGWLHVVCVWLVSAVVQLVAKVVAKGKP